MKDVCNVFVTMGNYDLVVTVCTTSEAELFKLKKIFEKREGVLRVDNVAIVERRKVLGKKNKRQHRRATVKRSRSLTGSSFKNP